jgi:hypothetical protein
MVDLLRAENFKMRRHDLNVEPRRAALPEMFDEMQKREFRSIRARVEHAFAAENAARVNAVKPADQFRAVPDLDAVRVAARVKIAVRADEFARDPGSVTVASFRPRARADDRFKIPVDRE